ncbi:bifunctional glutamine synthetase adenylyltransferase/deadenyltransferase [Methylovorus sp. MM2]|uniref:bifunctional [glutamate--ammonia ligase]-adenylyl-L-tyrosine phosphorylase/[glutamate--ammonia-ligase] adenylyltransferase n=1 Tax=Methylovorus sp. MM2 TaxID=1848038 RepID=UPI0007DF5F94|nr:bifunctional [glutamate--ammonia ligase]-adenylyl-L-tyrosine phosphorylase/[glutamate--ammonia-ligase] adenylyltransferase [Methylovorus sp. MM2]OAM52806.1 bifunctional glutamine synthetase adenylyltransferase/deadenyltransferase [Methylovorus sp. MM2]
MLTLTQILENNDLSDATGALIRYAVLCSPFVKRLLVADADLLNELVAQINQPITEQEMRDWLTANEIADEVMLKKVLRKLRQRVILRVISRDLNGLADLQEVVQTMTSLAEVTVQFALQCITPWLEAIYGEPIGETGEKQSLIVVGMGKLGGKELNASSDIDLIFAFEEDGQTNGTKSLSNHEFFTRLSKKFIAAIDEITADGFVFRVDMRLRPYGSDGPLACSFAMLEEYYQNHGREWERYAWIKGRVIAGEEKNLAALLRPFVFRKYLDFGAFASMRDLKVQIQRDVNRRDMHDNIKLGRGGIREIEFIAQVFQLIRGGRDTGLQVRPTLKVLHLLGIKGLLPQETVDELTAAYIFLRNLEHRLQYVDDMQIQDLPVNEEGRARIALAMGYADWPAMLVELEKHRTQVQFHFDEVFNDPQASETPQDKSRLSKTKDIWLGAVAEPDAIAGLTHLGYRNEVETLRRLRSLHASPRYKALPDLSHQRFDVLMSMVIELAAQESNPEDTLMRVSDLMDSICRRASYLALLAEYPAALSMLIKLASASPWLAQYLTQHPILLDELLDMHSLYAVPDFAAMRVDLAQRLAEVEGDVERQMDVMRHFKHAAVFRFAAQDIAGELQLQTLSDYLSELANLILQATMDTVWRNLKNKHREQPQFAVIGYGKLGGKELSYASDLDIIFLYDDEAAGAGEVYARFGQRISNWLNSLTSAGLLYETDLQLRPDGASGLLVSSVKAFQSYQQHKAWVWEHQALTRAGFSAGDSNIGEAFEKIRHQVLVQKRDLKTLRAEVVEMRQKMRDAHTSKPSLFDLKQDVGGIIDVEFIVQYLVLASASDYDALTENIGNIRLLERLASLGLVDAVKAEGAATAYREFRRLQHVSHLQGRYQAYVAIESVQPHVEAVRDLWQTIFRE